MPLFLWRGFDRYIGLVVCGLPSRRPSQLGQSVHRRGGGITHVPPLAFHGDNTGTHRIAQRKLGLEPCFATSHHNLAGAFSAAQPVISNSHPGPQEPRLDFRWQTRRSSPRSRSRLTSSTDRARPISSFELCRDTMRTAKPVLSAMASSAEITFHTGERGWRRAASAACSSPRH